jgi:AraC-like DNA-binding protein
MTPLSIFLLLASAQGIMLSLALLTPRERNRRSNSFLGLIIFTISLELLHYFLLSLHSYNDARNIFPLHLIISYWTVPAALFLWVETVFGDVSRKRKILFFIPAFLEIATETGAHIYFKITGNAIRLIHVKGWFIFTEVLPIFAMCVVAGLYYDHITKAKKKISGTNTVRSFISRQYFLFTFFASFNLLWFSEVVLGLAVFQYTEILMIVFLFVIGYIGYFSPDFFSAEANHVKRIAESAKEFPYDDQLQLKRLERLFLQEKVYSQPKLTTDDVAKGLHLPSRYVSYLINTYHHTSVTNYVNKYRVEEVINRMADATQRHKTLLALALESGFNSKSSFNQIFKAYTGKTPSDYMTEHITSPKT